MKKDFLFYTTSFSALESRFFQKEKNPLKKALFASVLALALGYSTTTFGMDPPGDTVHPHTLPKPLIPEDFPHEICYVVGHILHLESVKITGTARSLIKEYTCEEFIKGLEIIAKLKLGNYNYTEQELKNIFVRKYDQRSFLNIALPSEEEKRRLGASLPMPEMIKEALITAAVVQIKMQYKELFKTPAFHKQMFERMDKSAINSKQVIENPASSQKIEVGVMYPTHHRLYKKLQQKNATENTLPDSTLFIQPTSSKTLRLQKHPSKNMSQTHIKNDLPEVKKEGTVNKVEKKEPVETIAELIRKEKPKQENKACLPLEKELLPEKPKTPPQALDNWIRTQQFKKQPMPQYSTSKNADGTFTVKVTLSLPTTDKTKGSTKVATGTGTKADAKNQAIQNLLDVLEEKVCIKPKNQKPKNDTPKPLAVKPQSHQAIDPTKIYVYSKVYDVEIPEEVIPQKALAELPTKKKRPKKKAPVSTETLDADEHLLNPTVPQPLENQIPPLDAQTHEAASSLEVLQKKPTEEIQTDKSKKTNTFDRPTIEVEKSSNITPTPATDQKKKNDTPSKIPMSDSSVTNVLGKVKKATKKTINLVKPHPSGTANPVKENPVEPPVVETSPAKETKKENGEEKSTTKFAETVRNIYEGTCSSFDPLLARWVPVPAGTILPPNTVHQNTTTAILVPDHPLKKLEPTLNIGPKVSKNAGPIFGPEIRGPIFGPLMRSIPLHPFSFLQEFHYRKAQFLNPQTQFQARATDFAEILKENQRLRKELAKAETSKAPQIFPTEVSSPQGTFMPNRRQTPAKEIKERKATYDKSKKRQRTISLPPSVVSHKNK